MVRRALICGVLGCGGSPKVAPPPAPVPADVGVVAVDPPEPTAPVAECTFEPKPSCHDGVPVMPALQAAPFETCAPTQPARETSVYPTEGKFSAVETRKARASNPRACCYIEFVTRACD